MWPFLFEIGMNFWIQGTGYWVRQSTENYMNWNRMCLEWNEKCWKLGIDHWNQMIKTWSAPQKTQLEGQKRGTKLDLGPDETIQWIQRIWTDDDKKNLDSVVQTSFNFLKSVWIPDTESGKEFEKYAVSVIENLYLLEVYKTCSKTCHIAYA